VISWFQAFAEKVNLYHLSTCTAYAAVVLMPQKASVDDTVVTGGVSLTGDGVVTYESGALPGVTIKVGLYSCRMQLTRSLEAPTAVECS
jgi:hypothetical protein